MAELSSPIRVQQERHGEVTFAWVSGILDGVTYRQLRDAIIKAALEEPRAVVVDVNDLWVPRESAWSVFTSARWHVSTWPDVPVLLVCADPLRRQLISRLGVPRYVPVHPTSASAVEALADGSAQGRRRARTQLPASLMSVRLARDAISDWLTAWGQEELIPVAGLVATIFVENVLAHTDSAPLLFAENYQGIVTVAVEDHSSLAASRHEDADHGAAIVSGLAIVSALCRAWGSTPTSSGKTVWALVGRENQL